MLCKVSQSNPALSMLSIDKPYFSDKSYGKIDIPSLSMIITIPDTVKQNGICFTVM